ncbi:MAG: hypothetical protein WCN87_02165 [Chlamydiota bacterium]
MAVSPTTTLLVGRVGPVSVGSDPYEEAWKALHLSIRSVADKFFTGPGCIVIGSSLRIIPETEGWTIKNLAAGHDFSISSCMSRKALLEPLCISPVKHLDILEDAAAITLLQRRLIAKLPLDKASLITYNPDTQTRIIAQLDQTLHVFKKSDTDDSIVKLVFSNGLILFTKRLRKGYSIFNGQITKEPYKKGHFVDDPEMLTFFTRKALALFSAPRESGKRSIPIILLSGVLKVTKADADLRAENITTRLKGPLYLQKDPTSTFDVLPLEPVDILKLSPEKHVDEIPALDDFYAGISACQARGEKAYAFTNYLGIIFFSWPNNTIQVVCSLTYTLCYQKLTFADGTSFYTQNVQRGISTYRIAQNDCLIRPL